MKGPIKVIDVSCEDLEFMAEVAHVIDTSRHVHYRRLPKTWVDCPHCGKLFLKLNRWIKCCTTCETEIREQLEKRLIETRERYERERERIRKTIKPIYSEKLGFRW